ncbi:hypothetical protein HLK59_35500 [Streptomyces sp. S3(2020)]|uniref:hypothetical protein n=1 Tax=Streptomyces sp. S3(2020) TaxID=2732044 RepID=UPI001489F078|nr:hypothetical protein [Streptomyces sp. S3(2020)]NNN35579.1 hypothetical protein [Streptomyces sp. S3(2020)]
MLLPELAVGGLDLTYDEVGDGDLVVLVTGTGAQGNVWRTWVDPRTWLERRWAHTSLQELALSRPELVRRGVAMAAHERLDEVNRRLNVGE